MVHSSNHTGSGVDPSMPLPAFMYSIILCVNFKISLGMCAHRADLRGRSSHHDMSAVPALPDLDLALLKDLLGLHIFQQGAVLLCFICPQGCQLRHTTTDKNGKRFYRSTPKDCRNCPCWEACGANAKGQRLLTTHIWQEYLDLAEQLRKTERGKDIYALRKETIERVFADAKDKHGLRYTHRRGLARVSAWVRLKFAALNLKKLALWASASPPLSLFFFSFPDFSPVPPLFLV